MVNYPFIEDQVSEKTFIRTFSNEINPDELLWHWDEEDRFIEPIEKTNWMFQFDNSLPTILEGRIHIKKGVWHRLIKGDNVLKLKIEKIN